MIITVIERMLLSICVCLDTITSYNSLGRMDERVKRSAGDGYV